MKKSFLILTIVIIVSSQTYAQWTNVSGTGNYYLNSGKVGIGTTSPNLGVLQIHGATTSSPAIVALTPGLAQGERSDISLYSTFQGTPDNGPRRTADIIAGFTSGWGGEYLTFNVGINGIQNDINAVTYEKMRLLANGNVGIGTTTPDARLTVNGTIHAKEVKIDLSVPAPDYVFEKNYQLRSLQEVAEYISLNKHLPEIPSAKEMEQNGVNVNELNMKLLQKVEELTLYLIDKDKQVSSLQEEVNQLRQEQKNRQTQQEQINELKEQLAAIIKIHL